MLPLFDASARSPTIEGRREIAGQIQSIIHDQDLVVPFGQVAQPAAYRTIRHPDLVERREEVTPACTT